MGSIGQGARRREIKYKGGREGGRGGNKGKEAAEEGPQESGGRKVPGAMDRPRTKPQISFPQLLSYSEKGDMTREQ